MKKLAKFSLMIVFAVSLIQSNSDAQVTPYSQNFEALDMASPDALGNDGWLVGANVFDPAGNFIYNYFAFPAPNHEFAFSQIATGSGGPNQALQYLNFFSDYNNGDHANGLTIDAYIFQERVLAAEDLGMTYDFQFDFRRADDPFGPANSMTTAAYVRVLDPNNDFATVFEEFLDTTSATFDWSENNVISLKVDPMWMPGFFIQFGFNNNGTDGDPSGIYYDNVSFGEPSDCIKGDLNGDGMVTLLDVQGFVSAINNMEVSCEADIDGNGVVELLDVAPFVNLLSGGG